MLTLPGQTTVTLAVTLLVAAKAKLKKAKKINIIAKGFIASVIFKNKRLKDLPSCIKNLLLRITPFATFFLAKRDMYYKVYYCKLLLLIVVFMSDPIDEVQRAEKEAKEIIAKAEEEKKKIIADANREAASIIAKAEEEAKVLISNARSDAEKEIEQRKNKDKREIEQEVKKASKKKLSKSDAKRIAREIMEHLLSD